MRGFRLMVTILAVATVGLVACSSSASTITSVQPAEAAEVMAADQDTVVLDIRTAEEYQQGIIEGAVGIDFYAADFAAQLDQLDKSKHYVVYCRSGNRTGQAMGTFEDLGFEKVTEIDGGIVNWYESGLAVVAP